jgi:hypothetical protein
MLSVYKKLCTEIITWRRRDYGHSSSTIRSVEVNKRGCLHNRQRLPSAKFSAPSLIEGVSPHSQRIQIRISIQLYRWWRSWKFTNCKMTNLCLNNGSSILDIFSFSTIHASWGSSYEVQIGKAAILEWKVCSATWIMFISELSFARWILKPTIGPQCKFCRWLSPTWIWTERGIQFTNEDYNLPLEVVYTWRNSSICCSIVPLMASVSTRTGRVAPIRWALLTTCSSTL